MNSVRNKRQVLVCGGFQRLGTVGRVRGPSAITQPDWKLTSN